MTIEVYRNEEFQPVGKHNVILGLGSTSQYDHCVLIGAGLKSDQDYQVKIGNSQVQVSREMTPSEFSEIFRAMVQLTDASDAKRAELIRQAEQSAPVDIDERAEFEEHMLRDFPGIYLTRTLNGDSYRNPSHQGAWLSWQARAALERKP